MLSVYECKLNVWSPLCLHCSWRDALYGSRLGWMRQLQQACWQRHLYSRFSGQHSRDPIASCSSGSWLTMIFRFYQSIPFFETSLVSRTRQSHVAHYGCPAASPGHPGSTLAQLIDDSDATVPAALIHLCWQALG